MTRAIVLFSAVLILVAGTSFAQNPQPYAGLQARPLKALSDEQLDDLKAGRGMGLALAGELNGYPGPKHVLELAKELNLTEAQRARTQQLFDEMKAEAVPLGQQLIAAETDLDRQFSGRTITAVSLTAVTAAIGATQGTLRATHLKYHLAMMDVLTAEQIRRYGELRGYGAAAPPDIRRACTITKSEAWRRPAHDPRHDGLANYSNCDRLFLSKGPTAR